MKLLAIAVSFMLLLFPVRADYAKYLRDLSVWYSPTSVLLASDQAQKLQQLVEDSRLECARTTPSVIVIVQAVFPDGATETERSLALRRGEEVTKALLALDLPPDRQVFMSAVAVSKLHAGAKEALDRSTSDVVAVEFSCYPS